MRPNQVKLDNELKCELGFTPIAAARHEGPHSKQTATNQGENLLGGLGGKRLRNPQSGEDGARSLGAFLGDQC